MITLVTTTRDRPLAFSLLEKWISRQSVQPDQWIVVNDGAEPYQYTRGQTVLARHPGGDELPSICENWLAAVPFICGDKVIVAEDDDWYHPEYVATVAGMLDEVDLVGVRDNRYFKVRSRKFLKMHNDGHASLAATAFQSALLPQIERCCTVFKSVYIDMYLWAEATADTSGWRCALLPNEAGDGRCLQIGIKQMPGPKGLGLGHGEDGSTDPNMNMLREWIGAEDCREYEGITP